MKTPLLLSACAAALICSAALASDAPAETVACAQESGEALGQCNFSIMQEKPGQTTVTVEFANGFKRRLYFADGQFLKASVTMSGTGTDTDWTLTDGMYVIRVDDQRFDIPQRVIAGD